MKTSFDYIRENTLFKNFAENILKALDASGKERLFTKDSVLFEQGSVGDEIYMILEGKVCVRQKNADGDQGSEVVYLGEGEIIGEMVLIDDQLRSATVSAESDVKVKVWPASSWKELCEEYPKFGYELILGIARLLCQRLRHSNESIAVLNKVLWNKED